MSKRISVRVVEPCFIQGRDRKVGEMFLLDTGLLSHPDRLPCCLERVRSERPKDDEPELVEVLEHGGRAA